MFFFFFNDTATTEIYTLSLHDALPISNQKKIEAVKWLVEEKLRLDPKTELNKVLTKHFWEYGLRDRKSTRLNSSHANISYAVFCLKKKKNTNIESTSYNQTLHIYILMI